MSGGYNKTIICLANSRKHTGRCIAGKEINGSKIGHWIRPVSSRESGELSEEDRRFKNGQYPQLLDVVDIVMKAPQQHPYQPENHLIDDGYYWRYVRRATYEEVEAALDPVTGPLWVNDSSTYNGLNDRVAVEATAALGSSLKLISVADLTIRVATEGAAFGNGKRKVRGRFSLNGSRYWLTVTDPVIERQYLDLAGDADDATFAIGHAVLSISLGEPYMGYAYKLIAGVILPP